MVHGGHILDELHHLVGVADLIVVPGDHLYKGVGEGNAGGGVEDGGAGIAQEVGGDHGVLGIAQDALQLALGGISIDKDAVLRSGIMLPDSIRHLKGEDLKNAIPDKICLLYTSRCV